MAATDYGPEIKAAQSQRPKPKRPPPGKGSPPKNKVDTPAEAKAEGDTPAEMAADKKRGIVEGSPRDERMDMQAMQHPQGGLPLHHVQAATSIAHAILGHRGVG